MYRKDLFNDFDAYDDDDLYGDMYDIADPHREDLEDDSGPVDPSEEDDVEDDSYECGDMLPWEDVSSYEVDDNGFDF